MIYRTAKSAEQITAEGKAGSLLAVTQSGLWKDLKFWDAVLRNMTGLEGRLAKTATLKAAGEGKGKDLQPVYDPAMKLVAIKRKRTRSAR